MYKFVHDQNKTWSIQRWSNCDRYYDHGAGIETDPSRNLAWLKQAMAYLSKLCRKFCYAGYLLGQSSSSYSYHKRCKRRHDMGKSSSTILALIGSICNGMDGRKSLWKENSCLLCIDTWPLRYRLLYSPDDNKAVQSG